MGYETNGNCGNGWPTPYTKEEHERRKSIDKAWSEALAEMPVDKSERELLAENETLRAQNAELVRALKLAYRHMHMADHLQSEYAHALQTVSDTINKVQS